MEDRILQSTDELMADLNNCVQSLVSARIQSDKDAEERYMTWMESLAVSSLQQLQCLKDYIEGKYNV